MFVHSNHLQKKCIQRNLCDPYFTKVFQGWKVNKLLNWKLRFLFHLFSSPQHTRAAQSLHLPLHPTSASEQDTKTLELLHLRRRVAPHPEDAVHLFSVDSHGPRQVLAYIFHTIFCDILLVSKQQFNCYNFYILHTSLFMQPAIPVNKVFV